VTVNERRVDVPSFLVRTGDVIRVKNRPKSLQLVQTAMAAHGRDVPDFLSRLDGPVPEGHVLRTPDLADVSIPVQTNLIVELCSK
jgi:small subunit ribosomal protein S4